MHRHLPYVPQLPVSLRRWRPLEEDHSEWVLPSWGIKHLGRTVRIGTPEQQLLGQLGISIKRDKRTKKKKKDEEEGIFFRLFGGA